MFSAPVSHAFCSQFEQYERCFAYDVSPSNIVEPMSIILDEHAIVSLVPEPDTAVTREELLSLAAPVWQWWRRERPSVHKNLQNHITHIRIIETHPAENFLRMEVWKMSLICDVSLSRSVHKIFISNIDGSFKSSVVESTNELEILRPGTDELSRNIALLFLKNSIGWIDSSGNLTDGEYPERGSLINNVKGKQPTSANSQSFLSLKTSTLPEPQAIPRGEETRLDEGADGEAVDVPSPNKTDKVKRATARGTPEGSDEDSVREEARDIFMSATLDDGTLVIPSYAVCRNLKHGNGKGLSNILRIILQWRTQACGDLDHEYYGKPLLVYIFSKTLESSIQIEVFRKEPNWFEQPMTRYVLHHTLPLSGCSYVNSEPLPQTLLTDHQLRQWKKKLLRVFSRSLKNHIGIVDKAGVLRKSKQPSIDQFLYEFKVPTKLYLSAGTEAMESPKERYVPPSPTDTGQEGESHEKAPKVSMSDQIESVMRLAGDLYEVSTMLNEEISNAPSRPNGSPALDSVNASWMNEPNPVLQTRKHGRINVDAVDRAILKLKAQLRDHEDKAHILAHLCQRWKGELEVEYPLMKRESISRSGIHNLTIPPPKTSGPKSPVTKEKAPTGPQEPPTSPKITYTHSLDKRNDADDSEFSISPF
ncbi:hypothetical protein KCU65_g1593, partial [Aureobasidium melanogenum]